MKKINHKLNVLWKFHKQLIHIHKSNIIKIIKRVIDKIKPIHL